MRDPAFVDKKPFAYSALELVQLADAAQVRQGPLSFDNAPSGEEPLERPRLRLLLANA